MCLVSRKEWKFGYCQKEDLWGKKKEDSPLPCNSFVSNTDVDMLSAICYLRFRYDVWFVPLYTVLLNLLF